MELSSMGKYKKIDLNNKIIEVGFVPALGGRLMVMRFEGDPFNVLRTEKDQVINTDPGDVYKYYYGINSGGIRGVHTTGWPGLDLNDKVYDYKIKKRDGRPYIQASCEANSIFDTRSVLIDSNTTVVRIETTLVNKRDQYIDMMVRLNGEFRVGPKGSQSYYPEKDGTIRKIKYVHGLEEGRGFKPAKKNWIGYVDISSKTLMLIRYPKEEVKSVLFWTGAGVKEGYRSLEMEEDYYGFIGFNLYQKIQEKAPGEKRNMWQEHILYKNFTDIDFVAEDFTVFQVFSNVADSGSSLSLAAAFYRISEITDVTVQKLNPDNMSEVIEDETVTLTIRKAGYAETVKTSLSLDKPKNKIRIIYKGESSPVINL